MMDRYFAPRHDYRDEMPRRFREQAPLDAPAKEVGDLILTTHGMVRVIDDRGTAVPWKRKA